MRKLLLILALTTTAAHAAPLPRGKTQLLCHRTANRDIPENTLASLAYAARMGCDLVEVDVRTTADGTLVLNHDGYLERLTEGMGDIETTDLAELDTLDFGAWMSPRFAGTRVARLDDALRLARTLGIALHLDIKTAGQGPAILAALNREGMAERIMTDGEDGAAEDLKALLPRPTQTIQWFGPDVTAEQITAAHAAGKFTVANFSANAHEMDLPAMRAAVAAGIDAINVDYPRLGADAVGRPVEAKLQTLAHTALNGPLDTRLDAVRELSHYTGFPLTPLFTQLLNDPEPRIAHAAALAIVSNAGAPLTTASSSWVGEKLTTTIFLTALTSPNTSTRTAAAWALGVTHTPATRELISNLAHTEPTELKETLLALSRTPGEVSAQTLTPFLRSEVPTVRAAAALALAVHQPQVAAQEVPALLLRDEQRSAADYALFLKNGRHKLTQAEIDPIVEQYREHMKLIHAIELLPPDLARPILTTEAFRIAEDSSHVTSLLAGYGLWDLIDATPIAAIAQLSNPNAEVADRAEWMLVKADASVLPAARAAIETAAPAARPRLFHILAWHGDADSLPLLHRLYAANPSDPELLWSIQKIHSLQLVPEAPHAP